MTTTAIKPKRYLGPIADFVFVVLLPVFCFIFDPVLFVDANEAIKIAAYILFPTLMLCFYLSFQIPSQSFAGAIIEGSLLLGSGLAFAIGIVLLPLTLIGLLVIIGIAGFTPFFTASRFFKRFMGYWNPRPDYATHALGIIIGLCLPFLLPFLTYQLVQDRLDESFKKISSSDRSVAQTNLNDLSRSWYCQNSCVQKISSLFERGQLHLAKIDISPFFEKKVALSYDKYIEKQALEAD